MDGAHHTVHVMDRQEAVNDTAKGVVGQFIVPPKKSCVITTKLIRVF